MKKNTHPLQSPQWAEFRKQWGNEILKTLYGYLTLHKIPLTKFKIGMFIKGPTPTKEMVDYLKDIGRKNNLIFIKLEPNVKKDESIIKKLKSWGATTGKTLFTPSTFWIDLTPSEEELLKSFSQKTRYNIRVAQKHGVTVKEDNSDTSFEEYWKLHRETTARQGFFSHTKRYHQLMWKILSKAGIAHILAAKYNGEIITTWVVFTYDGFLYYPYGGSTDKYKQVMANNLMMWEAIKFGKKHNLTTFDLWGREENKGFTKFKEGYNPQVVEFLGTWDLVINKPLYWIYRFAETIRWKLLRLRAKIGR
ncbi:MAG: peptidoglycan bridge formation glycyltransferase FemA/FemB family protein [Patescibacteria group bacterium]